MLEAVMVLGMSGLAEPPTTITTEAPPNSLLSRFASVFSFFSILCCSCISKISNNTYLDNLTLRLTRACRGGVPRATGRVEAGAWRDGKRVWLHCKKRGRDCRDLCYA